MITRRAPELRCPSAPRRSRNSPVASTTTSTPASPQGISPGSVWGVQRILFPRIRMDLPSASTGTSQRPEIES